MHFYTLEMKHSALWVTSKEYQIYSRDMISADAQLFLDFFHENWCLDNFIYHQLIQPSNKEIVIVPWKKPVIQLPF